MAAGRAAERDRLAAADAGRERWREWGPYLAERAWGTVREDYSPDGGAWGFFPHDHARSRAYRWNEDGMAGVCDAQQTFCLGLALWNGVDPILKERMFGLTGPEGNHGEDVKDYWWYLDSTPTHSWRGWRYHYPQPEFPYPVLVAGNARRGPYEPEYELVDTGIVDGDRYWAVTVDYAKAGPDDLCTRIQVHNRGPEQATVHVLPTLWLRNTWAWGLPGQDSVPRVEAGSGGLAARHERLGRLTLAGAGSPRPLFCDNETNTRRLWGVEGRSAYPKDGINDHVVHGAATVNPEQVGTKAALHYVLTVPAGQTGEVRVRLVAGEAPTPDLEVGFTAVAHKPRYRGVVGETHVRDGAEGRLLSIVDGRRLVRILSVMLDPSEFLYPYGVRALSARHRSDPFTLRLDGMTYTVDYEPAESTSGLFGGNSNWRGPIWFPVNYLLIEAVRRFARFHGDDLLVEHPTGSGQKVTLTALADDLSRRLIRIFLDDPRGRRPVLGDLELSQSDSGWHDLLPFHEYFHGDTGRGLGAAHQTGWTGLVADLILGPAGGEP
jgi:hypothetical protein